MVILGFDPRVVKLMEEAYVGCICCICGEQATRMLNNKKLYCLKCAKVPENKVKEVIYEEKKPLAQKRKYHAY